MYLRAKPVELLEAHDQRAPRVRALGYPRRQNGLGSDRGQARHPEFVRLEPVAAVQFALRDRILAGGQREPVNGGGQ
jgi:hypothetical protein